jgi:hypothetical protein
MQFWSVTTPPDCLFCFLDSFHATNDVYSYKHVLFARNISNIWQCQWNGRTVFSPNHDVIKSKENFQMWISCHSAFVGRSADRLLQWYCTNEMHSAEMDRSFYIRPQQAVKDHQDGNVTWVSAMRPHALPHDGGAHKLAEINYTSFFQESSRDPRDLFRYIDNAMRSSQSADCWENLHLLQMERRNAEIYIRYVRWAILERILISWCHCIRLYRMQVTPGLFFRRWRRMHVGLVADVSEEKLRQSSGSTLIDAVVLPKQVITSTHRIGGVRTQLG